MKKFIVQVYRDIREVGQIAVEAEDAAKAIEAGGQAVSEGDTRIEWESSHVFGSGADRVREVEP
jgi:hypothetical protein